MSDSHLAQAGTDSAPEGATDIPTFAELAADPEIAPLLEFEPVPRKRVAQAPWTPDLQREFIARLATHGGVGRAADETGKTETSVRKLYRSPLAGSFRAAWHAAIELAKARDAEQAPDGPAAMSKAPSIDHRIKHGRFARGGRCRASDNADQWDDDETEIERRAEDAADSIRIKLLRCRRMFLEEISGSPGKRAAFEILTELPIDWAKAAAGEPQPDEPYNSANQREPDMILTAESGWSFGELGYGPDRKAELRRAIDEHRAAEGQPAVDWSGSDDEDGEDEE
jgi:hypothetical protein